ncbi:MAG: hypothetical protein V2A74_11800, partial [bacterium]
VWVNNGNVLERRRRLDSFCLINLPVSGYSLRIAYRRYKEQTSLLAAIPRLGDPFLGQMGPWTL